MKSNNSALVALVLVQLFYGVTFTFANDVIDGGYMQPFGFILFRVSFAGILFWIFSLWTPSEKIEYKDFSKFVIAAFFGGLIIEANGLKYVPILLSFGALLVFVSICFMPTIKSLPARHKITSYSLLSNRNFFPFLLACGAIQSSHGLYYGFSTIYWKSIGLSETIIGSLWAEGVVFEIILLAYFYKFKNYTSSKNFLILAGIIASIRWALMVYADNIFFLAIPN